MQEGNSYQFLNGFQAISRGAYEGGASFFAIQRYEQGDFSQFDGLKQRVMNSSADALGVAYGYALAGKRSQAFICDLPLKLLTNLSYSGVNGGLVIVYLEDTVELQVDCRPILKALHLPVLEPANPAEVKRFIKVAYNMSEKYDVPIVVRCNRDMLNCSMDIEVGEPKLIQDRPYKRDTSKYALSAVTLKLCADDIIERGKRLLSDGERFPIHTVYKKNSRRGIIACGEHADLANEVLSDNVLKLGTSYPLPINKIKDFASTVENLVVIEEHPYIQDILLAYGIKCRGREYFSREGRHSARDIAYALADGPVVAEDTKLPLRIADFCKSCPYAPIFLALKGYEGEVIVSRDCSVYASGYLSVAEVAMDYPIAIATGFAVNKKPIVILNERNLLKEVSAISNACNSGVRLIILSANNYDITHLLEGVGVTYSKCDLSDEDFNLDFQENALIVCADKLCKYEK